jgi:SAM-dependent methyltransferase
MSPYVEEGDLRLRFVDMIPRESDVMDCGKSLQSEFTKAKAKFRSLITLDINKFDDYPDYLVDICDKSQMKQFESRFDAISCFSLIEHCYNPIIACSNLFDSLRKSGVIVGSAPFLFPRHSPDDLSYQDFFRFTRDAYAVLFPNAREIELFPLRGRVSTSLNVLSTRYKYEIEERFEFISRRINRLLSDGRQALQTSGYSFIIRK